MYLLIFNLPNPTLVSCQLLLNAEVIFIKNNGSGEQNRSKANLNKLIGSRTNAGVPNVGVDNAGVLKYKFNEVFLYRFG